MNTSYQTSFKYKGSIIRQRGDAWQVETNLAGRRKRCTKPTQARAKAYAAAVAEQTKEDGARALELIGPEREETVRALRDFPTEAIRNAAREALEILSDSTRQDRRV